jgi:predicted extracellular nuclease
MWRRTLFAALIACLASCEDQQQVATPTSPPSTSPARDAGSGSNDGWGDPTTTKRAGILRIAHLNVRRYFDTTCESGTCGPGGFEEVVTEEQFAERTAELAAGLARLEADVITLAEVENQGCLDALQAKLKASGAVYPVAYVAETEAAGSIDVAVLARGKLDRVKTHRKETAPLIRPDGSETIFTRELPEVHLTIGDSTIIVFAAHFRSKSNDDPGRRLAEARKTQELVVAAGLANTGALVLLGGDLNDVPGSEPLEALEKDGALVRVLAELPPAEQGTYRFGDKLQAIDHLFTTAARATAYVPNSGKVIGEGNGGFAGSDHKAIYADFMLP